MFSKYYIFCLSLVLICVINVSTISAISQDSDIDARIARQMHKINRGEEEGLLKQQQAKKLKDGLNDIALQIENIRIKNNGKLTDTQITKFDNDLNQSFNNIQTQLGAGKKISQGSDALGPKWSIDTDGAQNPKKLKQEMKAQERRQLKQYDQAMQQKQELQQQEYEKEMLKTLGEQRPEVLKNKEELEKIRRKTGAD